ncbi:MAG TPA: IclR family transcriptional regulator [Mycobacteriales bacterium]|nr:IclR family transcriptional regulator [Mycobacteriales bacterium]
MVAGSPRLPEAVGPAPRYPIESVDNALRLLVLFAEQPRIRLTDASAYLEVASSTAHRLLAMLLYRGFVQQDATRAYEPGPVLRGLGSAALREQDLSGVARPVLERLHAELDGTIHLGRLDGRDVVFVDGVHSVKIARPPESVPAHCTSLGKMMLSQLEPDELRALYPQERLDQLTMPTIASRSRLEEELRTARRRGFAVSDEEYQVGVTSVAVALPGLGGVRYGVTAALEARRMTPSTRGGAVRALTGAAAELSTLV